MRFSDIPGTPATKQLLIDSVRNNHAAHAQLFLGAPGALNLPMALAYATYIHCENKGDDACGTCPACSKSLKYIHPDTHFVFPFRSIPAEEDKNRDQIKAETMKLWRSFVTENPYGTLQEWINQYEGEGKPALISKDESREIIKRLALKPFESKYKIMIIWQPETMHPSAANGILKILEEPPTNTFFILVTNASERLLPTILSRTQIVTIPLAEDETVVEYLVKNEVPSDRARQAAVLADGNLNLALRLAEGEESTDADLFKVWMRKCYEHDYGTLLGMADEFHKLDKLSQRNLMALGQNMLRESLLHLSNAKQIQRSTEGDAEFVQKFSRFFDLRKIEHSDRLLNEATYHLERNGSAKMIFLDLSLKLAEVMRPRFTNN